MAVNESVLKVDAIATVDAAAAAAVTPQGTDGRCRHSPSCFALAADMV